MRGRFEFACLGLSDDRGANQGLAALEPLATGAGCARVPPDAVSGCRVIGVEEASRGPGRLPGNPIFAIAGGLGLILLTQRK